MELAAAERFIRAVVLHDEICMELEPWPYEAEADPGFTDEEKAAGVRSVMVAIGPTLDGFDFFSVPGRAETTPSIQLSPALIETARKFSQAEPGNPHYKAHVKYLQRLATVVAGGGSALVSGKFGRTAIKRAAEYPDKLFETLDAQWQDFARRATEGDIGLAAPPLLSILLTRAAKREAIPTVLSDLRDEFADARRKVWQLLAELKDARTVEDAQRIKKQLATASELMSPASIDLAARPGRVLWNLVGSAVGGGATAVMSGGDPLIGAATGAVRAVGSAVPLAGDFGRVLFARGAVDLARRVRRETLKVEYAALARHLTKAELAKLESP